MFCLYTELYQKFTQILKCLLGFLYLLFVFGYIFNLFIHPFFFFIAIGVYDPRCGPEWEVGPTATFCYHFSDEQLSWFDARVTCYHHGGELASITEKSEQYFIAGDYILPSLMTYKISLIFPLSQKIWLAMSLKKAHARRIKTSFQKINKKNKSLYFHIYQLLCSGRIWHKVNF